MGMMNKLEALSATYLGPCSDNNRVSEDNYTGQAPSIRAMHYNTLINLKTKRLTHHKRQPFSLRCLRLLVRPAENKLEHRMT